MSNDSKRIWELLAIAGKKVTGSNAPIAADEVRAELDDDERELVAAFYEVVRSERDAEWMRTLSHWLGQARLAEVAYELLNQPQAEARVKELESQPLRLVPPIGTRVRHEHGGEGRITEFRETEVVVTDDDGVELRWDPADFFSGNVAVVSFDHSALSTATARVVELEAEVARLKQPPPEPCSRCELEHNGHGFDGMLPEHTCSPEDR